jgi:hypothetical protein
MDRSGAPLTSTGDHNMQDRLPIALHAEGYLMPVSVSGHFGSLREVIVVSKLSGSQKASGCRGFPLEQLEESMFLEPTKPRVWLVFD